MLGIYYTWSKTRLIENVFTLNSALTLTLTLNHNNVFGLTKWRHFSIKCTNDTLCCWTDMSICVTKVIFTANDLKNLKRYKFVWVLRYRYANINRGKLLLNDIRIESAYVNARSICSFHRFNLIFVYCNKVFKKYK